MVDAASATLYRSAPRMLFAAFPSAGHGNNALGGNGTATIGETAYRWLSAHFLHRNDRRRTMPPHRGHR